MGAFAVVIIGLVWLFIRMLREAAWEDRKRQILNSHEAMYRKDAENRARERREAAERQAAFDAKFAEAQKEWAAFNEQMRREGKMKE